MRKIQEDPTEVEKPTASIHMIEHTILRRNLHDRVSCQTGICSSLLSLFIIFNSIISILLLRLFHTLVSFSQQMAQDINSFSKKKCIKLQQTILNQQAADMIVFLIHLGRANAGALSRGHSIPLHPELRKVVTRDALMYSDSFTMSMP